MMMMMMKIESDIYAAVCSFLNLAIFMTALCNRAGHYIFALWFLLFSIFFISSPNLSHRRLDWMSTILPHMVWP